MPKALKFIQNLPENEVEKHLDIKRFVKAVEFALSFAPDRSHSEAFKLLGTDGASILHTTTEIQAALEKSFFEELYVDRPEREQIESDLPGQRLVLVNGLVGTGKTVILLKVEENMIQLGARFAYFDLKANSEFLRSVSPEKIPEKIRNMIYAELIGQYINNIEFARSWDQYRFQNDPNLIAFRQVLRDILIDTLASDEQLNDLLNRPSVKQRLEDFIPTLQTLIKFLLGSGPLILCFDNVDRYPIEVQRYILETCIDLSNDAEIPVILAIREANLRRITASGALGDITFIEKLTRHAPKYVNVHEFKFLDSKINEGSNSDTSIAELLSKRLKFIRDHHEFAPLGAYFKYLNSKYGFGLSVGEYTTRFWDVFNVISKTFVDGHVYSYCNYSIRKILVMYFGFIDKLLLNPDSGYKIETILTEKKHVRITKLRNYFYKWLLCSDEAVPPDERNLINIYDYSSPQHMNYHNLNHKILTYLYNRKAIAASSSITLREIEDDFEYFGIKRDHVSAQLMELTNDQDFEEETLIWREISTSPADRDTISFMLMPAGKYFIEKLGSSREYAFWNALDTDIADDLLAEVIKAKKIPYAETFSDRLKLDLVHDFVRLVLYPRLTRELKSLMTSPGRISTHDISKMRKYWQLFGIGGHSYEVSLLISVKDTIDHTSLDRVEQAAYHTKYRDLITLLKASEQTYGLTHL